MATQLAECSASELVALYRGGEASPVETIREVLQRVEHLNPQLNAFCHLDPDATLALARASESRWRRNRKDGFGLGLLDGVPVSIKDLVLTRGWPTLRGSHTVSRQQAWDIDAPVTARLREAGAVLLGKTTTPEFGCKGETNSPLTGLSRNPWNPERTPGGSSGGAAAAVASGMGPLAIGTDGAGSIRIPSAFCGTFGLKPSFGRVPAYPLSPFGTVAHLGPLSMSVLDAALMLNIIKRPDARDWHALPSDYSDSLEDIEQGVREFRVAWSPTLGYAKNVHPEVARAVKIAAMDFTALGAEVDEIDPGFEDPLEIITGLWFLGAAALWKQLSPEQQALADPDFAAQAEQGLRLSALDVHALNQRRGELGSTMRQFMVRYDLLLTPAVAVPAFQLRPAGSVPMTPESMLGWTPFSYPFNLTQQPACSIPCGLTSDGLPIGLQIVGPMYADNLVLRAARAYERIHPIPRPKPL